ncbi:hypothetical protein N781_16415 [Pontibacillus halophilus JSM 076056 = DSM 19796]|uniref:DUF4867 domain-containing protein n=1 Tax=Pontibacillus halophilus JSM 076056 = DSM 19796 TaxID=1385510 RepID=A0A0A5GME7_9BACI|nr:DUF4867 family protein [Pontibacillus halophilus]KGX92340.1 hypothetical protein N781_16415 [Pontibacillus halophilus JSM 076056 = DSM 19796]
MGNVLELNEHLAMYDVNSEDFKPFGRVLQGFPLEPCLSMMEGTEVPEMGNVYVASEVRFEQKGLKSALERRYYGGMDIQIGYCNGQNSHLGGLEFHKGSEINVAVTDFVLLLGHLNDMEGDTFHTDFLKAFYIPQGTAVELYQTTLHLAPCKVSDQGFKCMVILPKGTNTELSEEEKSWDPLLYMRNKWVLAHPEHSRFVENGAHVGIVGPNIRVNYKSE